MLTTGTEEFSIDLTNVGLKALVEVEAGEGLRFIARCRLETKVGRRCMRRVPFIIS